MNLLKNLAAPKKREASGPLSGKILPINDRTLKVEAVLGEGGFATIYRAVDAVTQEIFALKHFMLSDDLEAERDVQTEVALMRALSDCPHVLFLHGAALGSGSAFLVLDYCQGTLAGHLIERSNNITGNSNTNNNNRLSNAEVTAAFLPIARAVAAMHAMDPPMAHRDIKAENVLRRTDGSWVLCDFGSATSEQKVYSSPAEIAREEERIRKQTTPAYRAPELWDLYTREFIGTAVDIWSLGCLLYFIAYGKLPFDGDAKLQILNGKYAVPAGRPEGVAALLSDMLVVDPKGRITAAEVASRAVGMMMMPSTIGASGRPGNGDGGGASTEPMLNRPPVGVTSISKPSNKDAFTSNDTWGQEFDAVASSTPSTAAVASSNLQQQSRHEKPTLGPLAAAALPSGGSGEDTGGGNWADFNSPNAAPSSAEIAAGNGTALVESVVSGQQRQPKPSQPPPPTQQLHKIHLSEKSSQIQEHCQVLEQLLDERNKEVSTLRNELKRANVATTEIEATLQQEREKNSAVVMNLNQEIDILRQRAARAEQELEALHQELRQQQARNEKLMTSNSISSNTSGGGGGGSVRGLSSFPLVTDASDDVNVLNNTQPISGGLRGAPMRRQNSATSSLSSGRASPEKRMLTGLIAGRQDSFFKDLNPLG